MKMNSGIFVRYETLWTLLVFLFLAVYALGANPLKGETVAPFDQLLEYPGWSSVHSGRPAVHFHQSDILDAQLPVWMALKDGIRKGKGFLWYPYGAGGQPLGTELCNPSFLIFLAVKDNGFAYYLVGLDKLLVSGFGAYLLLRLFLGRLPSLWGGLIFMLCGFNAAWFFWDHVATAMWIPWLLWATLLYLTTGKLSRLPVIGIVSTLLVCGGFPSVAAFGFYALFLLLLVWGIYDFLENKRRSGPERNYILKTLKRTGMPLIAVGISFMMSAFFLAAFRDLTSGMNFSYRAGGGTYYEGFRDLLLFVFYEHPMAWAGTERSVYAGIPACIFALAGLFSLSRGSDRNLKIFVLFNLVLVIITVLIAFGLLPHRFIATLPVFSTNRWNRLVVVALLGLASLSAAGLHTASARLEAFFGHSLKLKPQTAQWLTVSLIIAITAIQFQSQKKLFNALNAVTPSAAAYPMTPAIDYVGKHIKPLQSVIADDSYWYSGMLGAYGISEWYGHSLKTDNEKAVLSELVHDPFGSATVAMFSAGDINLNSPLMDKLVIKYLMINKEFVRQHGLPEHVADRWNVLDLEREILVLENRNVTGGVYFIGSLDPSATEPAKFTGLYSDMPASGSINIDYSGKEAGWVVLPMHMHPGWKAYIGGRPAQYDAYMGILPAVPVQGACNIAFRYEPAYFRWGVPLSITGLVVFCLFCLWCVRYDKARQYNPADRLPGSG